MLELKARVQKIYYQTSGDELGFEIATKDTKISMAEAENILAARNIDCKEVLKVKYEYVLLEISPEDIKTYLV